MLRKAASAAAVAESSAGADLATTLSLFSAPAKQKSVVTRHDRNYVASLGLQADQAESLTDLYETVGPGAAWAGGDESGEGDEDDEEDGEEGQEEEDETLDDPSLITAGSGGDADTLNGPLSALESTWMIEVYKRRLRRLSCTHRGIRGPFSSSMRNLNQVGKGNSGRGAERLAHPRPRINDHI